MKWLKWALIIFMAVLVVLGLYLAGSNKTEEYTKTEFLMDTTCSVTFYGKESEAAAEAVFAEVERIDKLMNMYNENSDVSRINCSAENEKIKVSEDTYKVLKTAVEVGSKSDGAFDVTVAPITSLWNFSGEEPRVLDRKEVDEALLFVGFSNLVLSDGNTVKKLNGNTKIDLGGAAKGYAGDCAEKIAKGYNLTGGIIDLGGNIICFGKNPKSKDGKWTVGIQKPFAPTGTYEKTVTISEGCVVTSGTYQRYFEKDGKRYHHIIDPKTGMPKNAEYQSVTVVCESSLLGDCISTAAFVLGKERGEELVKQYEGAVYYE